MKVAVIRCGNTSCSEAKDRMCVPNHDSIDSCINSTDIFTSTCLTDIVGIFKGIVLKGKWSTIMLLQHPLNLPHVVIEAANLTSGN